jgi:hypothetical protein
MVNHVAAANVAQTAWEQKQQQERYRSLAALEQDITAELQDTIAKREEREKSEKYLGLISGSALRWEEKMANQKAKTKEKADSDEEWRASCRKRSISVKTPQKWSIRAKTRLKWSVSVRIHLTCPRNSATLSLKKMPKSSLIARKREIKTAPLDTTSKQPYAQELL